MPKKERVQIQIGIEVAAKAKIIALESSPNNGGLPSKLLFEVPVTETDEGKLVLRSIQGKDWELGSVIAACDVANKRTGVHKLQIVVYESHPKILTDLETGDEEVSQLDKPELFQQVKAYVDIAQRKLFFEVELLGTEISELYAQAIDQGYEPNISIRAAIACPNAKPGEQTGDCFIPEGHWITFDILKPGETPGIKGSKFSKVLERIANLSNVNNTNTDNCPCGSTPSSCQCDHLNIDNSNNSNTNSNKPNKTHLKKIAIEGVPPKMPAKPKSKGKLAAKLNLTSKTKTRKQSLANLFKSFQTGLESLIEGQATEMDEQLATEEDEQLATEEDEQLATEEDELATEEDEQVATEEDEQLATEEDELATEEDEQVATEEDTEETTVATESVRRRKPIQKAKTKVGQVVLSKAKPKLGLEAKRSQNKALIFKTITNARQTNQLWPLPEHEAVFGFESVLDVADPDVCPPADIRLAVESAVKETKTLREAALLIKERIGKLKTKTSQGKESGDPTTSGPGSIPKKTVNPNTVAKQGTESAVFSQIEAGKESERFRETLGKLVNRLITSSPNYDSVLAKRKEGHTKFAFESFDKGLVKSADHLKLNAIHDRIVKGRKLGKESVDVLGLSSDVLNREMVLQAIMRLAYWQSPVSMLTSPSITQGYEVGRLGTIGNVPVCQFYDVKSRKRNQREWFDAEARERPNDAIRGIVVTDRYDQYAGYFTSSQIPNTVEARMFLGMGPLNESLPTDFIFELADEKALEWTLRVSFEIVQSALRYKAETVTAETVQANDNVRKFASSGITTIQGLTFGVDTEVIAAVLPEKDKTASDAVLGPLVFPETIASNDRGTGLLTLNDPIIVKLNGVTLRRGVYHNGVFYAKSNRSEDQNPQYAVHPSGLLLFSAASGLTTSHVSSGLLVLHQYSYTKNYITLNFEPGDDIGLQREQIANREFQKVQTGISTTATRRNAPRANAVWANQVIIDYLSYAQGLQKAGINALDFAAIAPGFANESGFDAFKVRGQDYLASNDPIIRSGILGAVFRKGRTTAMKMGNPEIVNNYIIGQTDENGYTQPTNQEVTIMRECDFINTITNNDSNGDPQEFEAFALFCPNPPESADLPT